MEETWHYAELVQQCIEQLGGKISPVKAVLGDITGMMNSVASGPFKDEAVKNFLSDYAAEHLEIASYRALIAAAQEFGATNVVSACEEILRDEEAMANWLQEHLPGVVHMHLRENVSAAAPA